MTQQQVLEIDRSTYDHYNKDKLIYKSKPGLTREIVEEISFFFQDTLKSYEAPPTNVHHGFKAKFRV